MSWALYSVDNTSIGHENVDVVGKNKLIFKYPCESTSICTHYSVHLSPGKYRFEAYGAGKISGGAYVSGFINLPTLKRFYLYIGGRGEWGASIAALGGYNGGGGNIVASESGSGSTDIRLDSGEWSSFISLRSRIFVAAGSGATDCGIGGVGGALNGVDGAGAVCQMDNIYYELHGYGGTQTKGGSPNGLFGSAFRFSVPSNRNGGGGGYYGGGSSNDMRAGGAGGSSFISGHPKCDAITQNSTESSIHHSGQSIHYSNIFFSNSLMHSGNESFFDPYGNKIIGNQGNGIVVITKMIQPFSCRNDKYILGFMIHVIAMLVINSK